MPVAYTSSDVAYIALTIFLVAVRPRHRLRVLPARRPFSRLSSLIGGTERELLPVINKTGGTVDRVNHQLDKLDEATDSAVDAVQAVDEAVRAVSFAVKTPVKKSAGAAAGLSTASRRCDGAGTSGPRSRARRRPQPAARPTSKRSFATRAARIPHRPPPPPPAAPPPPPPEPVVSPPPGGIFEPRDDI